MSRKTKVSKCQHKGDKCFRLSKQAYNKFIKTGEKIPELKDKYVVFVHGKLEAVGLVEVYLVKQMYEKYGNITMYVGKISTEKNIRYIGEV